MNSNTINSIIKEYFAEGTKSFLPQISINCVVLGYNHPHLEVLINRFSGHEKWMLPGGYVKKIESIEEAAYRNLKLSGIENVYLKQIQTFGDVQRIPEMSISDFRTTGVSDEILNWANRRFVTIVYYGLVNLSATNVVPGGLLNEFEWISVERLDKLFLDHENIVNETRKILSTELLNQPVASSLLPETFTLKELRGLFEAILNRSIDRGTFRRKMLKISIIEQVDEKKEAKGQLTHVYRFNKSKYQRFLEEQTKYGF